jgi:hypothetical protein
MLRNHTRFNRQETLLFSDFFCVAQLARLHTQFISRPH